MPSPAPLLVRPAQARDLPTLGRYGAALAKAHHTWDPQRFFVVPKMAEGYAWWLGKEMKSRKAVVLVAERRGRVLGYAYGRLEPRNWNALLDACGVGVDLYVNPRSRGAGAGKALAEALLQALKAKGAPRIVLQAAAKNHHAQAFFQSLGFRPTMVEMCLETGKQPARRRKKD